MPSDFVVPHPVPLLPVELYLRVKLEFCQLFFSSLRRGTAEEAPQRKKLKRDNKPLCSRRTPGTHHHIWGGGGGQQSPIWSWLKISFLSLNYIVDYSRSHSATQAWDTWQDCSTLGPNILHMLSGLLLFLNACK